MENNTVSSSSEKKGTKITFQRPQPQNQNYRIPPDVYDNLNEAEKIFLQEKHANSVPAPQAPGSAEKQDLSEDEKMDQIEKQALLRLKEYESAKNKYYSKEKKNSQRSIRILMLPALLIMFLLFFYAAMQFIKMFI